MANETTGAEHWRDSSRNPRFFFVDALAAIPLVLMLLHIRLWTLIAALVIIGFFVILEKFKFTVPVFLRWIKAQIAGSIKTAYPWWRN